MRPSIDHRRATLPAFAMFAALVVLTFSTGACDLYSSSGGLAGLGSDEDEDGDGSPDEGDYATEPKRKSSTAAKSCKQGVAHMGFGGSDLNAGRAEAEVGVDRRRVKPFKALTSEFARALGAPPAALAQNAAAFGDAPPRWYVEPRANAVSVYTNYSVAFSGCYDGMTAATYATAPTPDSANQECATRLRAASQATPSREELAACVEFATSGSAGSTDPRRRWAHLCASILTSAAFTTY